MTGSIDSFSKFAEKEKRQLVVQGVENLKLNNIQFIQCFPVTEKKDYTRPLGVITDYPAPVH